MSVTQELLHFFENHLHVKTISEKVMLFSKESYLQEMAHRNFETAVIKTRTGLLKFDKGDQKPTTIPEEDILPSDFPLFEAFRKLAYKRRYFITTSSKVTHIVTQSDLDKIPVRLGLFGIISVFETYLKDLVRNSLPQWEESLSKERLHAARKLYELKASRSEEIDLVQCLQFVDLGSIFSKKKRYKKFDPSLTRQDYDDMLRNIGKLRDALAHSQAVLPFTWQEIDKMLTFMHSIIQNDTEQKGLKL